MYIGGPANKLLCLDPDLSKVQGREFFNTFQEIRIKIEHCNECGGVDLFEYWDEVGIAIHNIENNIDL